MAPIETGGGSNDGPGKRGDVMRFPERTDDRRAGFEQIAKDLNSRLTDLMEKLHITEDNVQARIDEDFGSKTKDLAEKLKQILEDGAGQLSDDFYKSRVDVTYYLAASRAYLALKEPENIEKEFEAIAKAVREQYPEYTDAQIDVRVATSLRQMQSGYTAILASLAEDPDWKNTTAGDPLGYCAVARIYLKGLAD